MKKVSYLVAFLFCACLARASDIDFSSDGSGKPHPDFMVDAEHIARLPRWSLEDGTPPPLELNDALKLVRARVQKQIPDMDWRLSAGFVRLKRDGDRAIPYYEFYVDYRRKEVRDSWAEHGFGMIVLMDGTVLASPVLER